MTSRSPRSTSCWKTGSLNGGSPGHHTSIGRSWMTSGATMPSRWRAASHARSGRAARSRSAPPRSHRPAVRPDAGVDRVAVRVRVGLEHDGARRMAGAQLERVARTRSLSDRSRTVTMRLRTEVRAWGALHDDPAVRPRSGRRWAAVRAAVVVAWCQIRPSSASIARTVVPRMSQNGVAAARSRSRAPPLPAVARQQLIGGWRPPTAGRVEVEGPPAARCHVSAMGSRISQARTTSSPG